MFNVVLLGCIIFGIYYFVRNMKPCTKPKEHFINTEKIFYPYRDRLDDFVTDVPSETKKITFEYTERPVDKQFIKEQDKGMNINTWYPNTWIESIDENGDPVYNSRENVTGEKSGDLISSQTRFSPEFNETRVHNIDGVMDMANINKTIKEVYESSFVDYKKMIPEKKLTTKKLVEGASSLSFFSNDEWVYEDEKPENGGMIGNELYAYDMDAQGMVATF